MNKDQKKKAVADATAPLIASFQVNHDSLERGMYISRIDGDAITYDIRMKKPNNLAGDYLTPKVLHTLEHLLATYLRFSKAGAQIIYVGPMGCRTGFYLVARDALTKSSALELVRKAFAWIASYDGEIPGAKREECGNYREHDFAGARKEAQAMSTLLASWQESQMTYPKE